MEAERVDLLPSFWPACIGFALSQIAVAAVMVMLAFSAADPKVGGADLRGSLPPELTAGSGVVVYEVHPG